MISEWFFVKYDDIKLKVNKNDVVVYCCKQDIAVMCNGLPLQTVVAPFDLHRYRLLQTRRALGAFSAM